MEMPLVLLPCSPSISPSIPLPSLPPSAIFLPLGGGDGKRLAGRYGQGSGRSLPAKRTGGLLGGLDGAANWWVGGGERRGGRKRDIQEAFLIVSRILAFLLLRHHHIKEEESVEVDDGEGGQKQTVRLVKGPITGNGDEECDARLQGEGWE